TLMLESRYLSKEKPTPVEIHPAELIDLNECYQLNSAYTTDYVWQMQMQNNGRRTDIRFDIVRLPRPMQVPYPRSPDELLDHWEEDHCFLVAYNKRGEVVGYIDAQAQPWQNLLWISNLVVDKDYRRQGYGSSLLESGRQWALKQKLHRIMLEAQTKNHPVISFAQKHGFKFCGYNERYYANGDIALFFSKTI
ncbi:MAG: GNAT family N-acetyltransferase, partial [Anaerolineae bacterium]|nr:GNAT family N-acetyltransferase [Anaerolineae bacterium]